MKPAPADSQTTAATAGEIMRHLKERWKIEAEFSEPGHDRWRVHKTRAELLREIITEFWNVK